MTESLNLAAAVAWVAYGHDLPSGLCELALLSAGGLLLCVASAWTRRGNH